MCMPKVTRSSAKRSLYFFLGDKSILPVAYLHGIFYDFYIINQCVLFISFSYKLYICFICVFTSFLDIHRSWRRLCAKNFNSALHMGHACFCEQVYILQPILNSTKYIHLCHCTITQHIFPISGGKTQVCKSPPV